MTAPDVLPCRWCLSTPPRHDRCETRVWVGYGPRTGTTLDSVGATIPTYATTDPWAPCPCPCRQQDTLW